MWFPPPSIILYILYALPFALGAPADTPATTTLLPVTRAPSSTFPLQTPKTRYYSSVGRREDGESDDMANIEPLNSDPSLTATDFVPAPTGSDGEAQHWYIVTYWSCVLVFPDLLSFLSTLVCCVSDVFKYWEAG
ncbi:hypothetical protein ACLOAV_005169 [Pseudogymnoascus australis]